MWDMLSENGKCPTPEEFILRSAMLLEKRKWAVELTQWIQEVVDCYMTYGFSFRQTDISAPEFNRKLREFLPLLDVLAYVVLFLQFDEYALE